MRQGWVLPLAVVVIFAASFALIAVDPISTSASPGSGSDQVGTSPSGTEIDHPVSTATDYTVTGPFGVNITPTKGTEAEPPLSANIDGISPPDRGVNEEPTTTRETQTASTQAGDMTVAAQPQIPLEVEVTTSHETPTGSKADDGSAPDLRPQDSRTKLVLDSARLVFKRNGVYLKVRCRSNGVAPCRNVKIRIRAAGLVASKRIARLTPGRHRLKIRASQKLVRKLREQKHSTFARVALSFAERGSTISRTHDFRTRIYSH